MFRINTLLVLLLFCMPAARAGKIVYPGKSCPAIVQTGRTIDILYDNPATPPVDSVILRGPFNRVSAIIEKKDTGNFEYDNFTKAHTSHRLTVRIPDGTPEELYDLIVVTPTSKALSPRSVKVVRNFRKVHTVLHFSDPHVGRQWVQGEKGEYAKELELLDKFIPVANLIAPDFIMVTGDLIHDYTRFDAKPETGWGGYVLREGDDGPTAEEKFKNYFEGACGFSGIWGLNAPVFSSTGNHDFYGKAKEDFMGKATQWNKMVGKRVYGFSYNGTRVIVTDDFLGDPQTDRPEAALMSGLQGEVIDHFLEEEGPGEFLIWGKHSHSTVDTAFMDRNRVRIILHGHSHTPKETWIGQTPTLHARTGVVCRSGNIEIWKKTLGFFRLFTIDGNSFEHTPPLRFCSNPTAPYDELDLNLKLDYTLPNDGTQARNEAVITNKFDRAFPNGRVRFVMQKGRYALTGGRLNQTIETDRFSVLDVDVDISASGTTKISVQKTD